MLLGGPSRSSRAVLVVFLSVAVLSTGLLAALGWLLLKQDRDLEDRRTQEHRDQAAVRLQASLNDGQSDAGSGAVRAELPAGTLLITLDGPEISVNRDVLAYYPYDPVRGAEAPAQVFEEGERLEYIGNDYTAAVHVYGKLAASSDAAVRAGALGRLARVQRKLLDVDDALLTYERLASIKEAVSIDGFPATLFARVGRASALERANRPDALRDEAHALESDLKQGRWPLSRFEYVARRDEVTTWLGVDSIDDGESLAYAEAVEWLWQNRDSLASSSRRDRVVPVSNGEALVVWAPEPGRIHAGVAGPAYLVTLAGSARDEASSRRNLLATSFVAIGLILVAGWYFILRAIAREQRTAQLQTDFVSAVSHEFRSPLTSMAHLAEMLETDRFPSDETRRTSYGVLVRDTNRLRRLVEDLLDFRRFETGTAALQLEPVDLVDLVRSLVTDFQARSAPSGYHIELIAPDMPIQVAAERESLARALGNLIDNAIKYSPECRTVWVELARESERVAISVRDQGIGIPLDEQQRIFDRFVRGAQAKAMRIKGTGIGLAIVHHVVRAHGGEVRVASEPGQGSRFTILLRDAEPLDVARGSPELRRRAGAAS